MYHLLSLMQFQLQPTDTSVCAMPDRKLSGHPVLATLSLFTLFIVRASLMWVSLVMLCYTFSMCCYSSSLQCLHTQRCGQPVSEGISCVKPPCGAALCVSFLMLSQHLHKPCKHKDKCKSRSRGFPCLAPEHGPAQYVPSLILPQQHQMPAHT